MLAIDGWGQNHVRQSVQMGFGDGPPDPDSPQGAYLQIIGMLIDPAALPPPGHRRARGARRR